MRLRHMVSIGPSPNDIRGLGADDAVTFAPMDALADGLGGLDVSLVKPLAEFSRGSYNYFSEGDILLAKVTPCFENGKKAIARDLVGGVGFATSEVHVIRPDSGKIETRFLRYLLCSEDFRAEGIKSMTGAGGLRRVSENAVLNYRPKITALEAQKTIAEFLDRETARIDQLIEKKERLVEILLKKDKATIKLHVLGQLGERERVPSEAVWLPDLPSEWPVQRCAHIFRNLDSSRIPLNAEERADLEKVYPYYGASGVIDYVDRYIFDGTNILVGEDGANLVMQSTPIAFKASGKYWVNNHAHILHPRSGVLEYWVHALNQVPYEIFVTGSAQPKLTSEALGNIRLPCPPKKEQADIVTGVSRFSGACAGR